MCWKSAPARGHTAPGAGPLFGRVQEGGRLGQGVFDSMIEDLELNLREMGVNDPSLGRRVKEMARAFYGRRDAYAAALDGGREGADRAAAFARPYRAQRRRHDLGP